MTGFEKFSLKKEIMEALRELKFDEPTEVQEKAIPLALQGKDLVVRSKTGSGKTAAFAIPIMQILSHEDRGVKALIVAPTRELALQIEHVIRKIGRTTRLKTTVVYGGVSTRPQSDRIREGASIIVGTPGRIIDLMERGDLDLKRIKFLILDEADIMLDMGFIDDIKYIIESTPEEKQTMLFSATIPQKIKEIARGYMRGPVEVSVGGEEELAVTSIENLYTVVDNSSKFSTLLAYPRPLQAKEIVDIRKDPEKRGHIVQDSKGPGTPAGGPARGNNPGKEGDRDGPFQEEPGGHADSHERGRKRNRHSRHKRHNKLRCA